MMKILEWVFRSPWKQGEYTWQFVVWQWISTAVLVGSVVLVFRWFG